MASRAPLVLLEPEVQLVRWACRDQKASQSVTRFTINHCNILDLILNHILFKKICFHLQGDAGKIGEAGSTGPPGQRVSCLTSDIIQTPHHTAELHKLILCLSSRG